MAVTMADCGMKVLVVDTDLRRPNVHRVLKMERGPGLSDVLREQIDVRSVIRSTRVENLFSHKFHQIPKSIWCRGGGDQQNIGNFGKSQTKKKVGKLTFFWGVLFRGRGDLLKNPTVGG